MARRLNGEPWNLLAAQALAAVRLSNPSRAVLIGPSYWNNAKDLPKLRMPADPGVPSERGPVEGADVPLRSARGLRVGGQDVQPGCAMSAQSRMPFGLPCFFPL